MLRFRLLDAVVAVETESEELAHLLELLWTPFVVDAGEPAVVLRVSGSDVEGWTVERPGRIPSRHADLWNLADVLRHYMLNDTGPGSDALVVVHAAAVARDSVTVLLPGASGSGKTTLTRGLLDAGWSYLSDDLVPIGRSTGLAHPFPKPLGIKDPSAWAVMPAPLGPSGGLPVPAGTFLAPASCWAVAGGPRPPTHVLFPSFRPGDEASVRALGGGETATRLMAHVRERRPDALSAMAELAGRCSCFDLTYGSSAAGVAAVQAAVEASV